MGYSCKLLCSHESLQSTNLSCFLGYWYPTISDIGSKCPLLAGLGGFIGCIFSTNVPNISPWNLSVKKGKDSHLGLDGDSREWIYPMHFRLKLPIQWLFLWIMFIHLRFSHSIIMLVERPRVIFNGSPIFWYFPHFKGHYLGWNHEFCNKWIMCIKVKWFHNITGCKVIYNLPLIKIVSCHVWPPFASHVGEISGFLDLQICIRL